MYCNVPTGSLNLTASLSNVCPGVTLTCNAVDLPTSILRWFFNSDQLAFYVYNMDQYPFPVEPQNVTLNDLVGGVDIQILEASLNVNDRDITNFLSTMTVNISALQVAGINNISCGSRGRKTTFNLSSSNGKFCRNPRSRLYSLRYL